MAQALSSLLNLFTRK